MPLRGRVGRHARTGANCQNWKSDQLAVIALLNAIPAADGGAQGTLTGRVIGGIASDALYQAILRYQKRHFPGSQTGFVEPGGVMLAHMQKLASRPPPPKPPGQWDDIKTDTVRKPLRAGLLDDRQLSHPEVVNIVRSTLSDGMITRNELDDLAMVATISRSLSPRSRRMLDVVYSKISHALRGKGPYDLPSNWHHYAAKMVCDFLERTGPSRFPRLDRDQVGAGLLMRLANPSLLNQDGASLCGPAVLLFGMASDDPIAYARFAIDLFEKGTAKLKRLDIKPGEDVRNYQPPTTMDHVDWLTMASIRDSENLALDYDTARKQFAGITMPRELADWMRRAGYSDIQRDANAVIDRDVETIDAANRLFAQGYRVCLFINTNMLYEDNQSDGSVMAEHWVVQRSPIDRANDKVKLTIFTWGKGNYQIPHGSKPLSVDDFLNNFYGYVAGKP